MNNTNHSKNTDLYDLKSNYTKVFKTLKHVAKEYFVYGENHRFYPNPPKMSDLAVVSLVLSKEDEHLSNRELVADRGFWQSNCVYSRNQTCS